MSSARCTASSSAPPGVVARAVAGPAGRPGAAAAGRRSAVGAAAAGRRLRARHRQPGPRGRLALRRSTPPRAGRRRPCSSGWGCSWPGSYRERLARSLGAALVAVAGPGALLRRPATPGPAAAASGVAEAVVELSTSWSGSAPTSCRFARLAAFGLTHAALGAVVWGATTALWLRGGPAVVRRGPGLPRRQRRRLRAGGPRRRRPGAAPGVLRAVLPGVRGRGPAVPALARSRWRRPPSPGPRRRRRRSDEPDDLSPGRVPVTAVAGGRRRPAPYGAPAAVAALVLAGCGALVLVAALVILAVVAWGGPAAAAPPGVASCRRAPVAGSPRRPAEQRRVGGPARGGDRGGRLLDRRSDRRRLHRGGGAGRDERAPRAVRPRDGRSSGWPRASRSTG